MRNPAIELYRVLLMFGIVLQHAAGKGSERSPLLCFLCCFCVPGFVFISGYFGIKFSWRKLVSLYATAAFCALVGAVVQSFRVADGCLATNWLLYMKWFWFLHAYAILMMFAPMLNLAVNQGYKLTVMPILVLVFGWSYCYQIGHLKPFVFPAAGLGAQSPLTLIGIYLLARWFRVSNFEERLSTKSAFCAILVSLAVASVGLAPCNSPFALAAAIGLFVLFKQKVKCGRWIFMIAPSMFSIYCLHSTGPGLDFIREGGNWLVAQGMSTYAMFFVLAFVLFCACLACDCVRRILVLGVRRIGLI